VKIILAGNYQQYLEYIEARLLNPNEVRFIGSESDLEGLPDIVEIIRIANWYDNPVHTSMKLEMLEANIRRHCA
jgi:hypothetical protein